MKDLTLKDIFPKANRPLGAVSVYRNGRWSFATLKTPTITSVDQQFFRIDFVFGIHKKGSKNPAKYAVKGQPGDYVAVDKVGTFSLVTADQFLLLYPKAQQTPVYPDNSDKLRNPNYLTKIQRESDLTNSDKVTIGNRSFSMSSPTKKTLEVVETPTGLAQVSYGQARSTVYDYSLSATVEVDVPDKPY